MITGSASSSASADRLWGVVVDTDRWAERVATVDLVTPLTGGPLATGARYEIRQPGLPPATYEVTELVPGRRFVWVARQRGLVSTAAHEVVPEGSGSRLDLSFDWSGAMAPLARLVGSRKGRRMLTSEASSLARAAEG